MIVKLNQPRRRAFDWPGLEKWNGDIYRESSHIQLTSHVFPPSDEKDCSIRDDLGEMLSQTYRTRTARPSQVCWL